MVFNRIITTGVERMAAQESSEGEDQTSDYTEGGDGLAGKFRTSGGKTTGRECPWRNYELVSSNGCEQKFFDHKQLFPISTATNSSRTS
jgi:hypothetical protein